MSHALFIALRYAFGGRKRSAGRVITLLSVVGLTLGTGLLITVLAVMNGFDRELRERILTLVPHVRLYTGTPLVDWSHWADLIAEQPGVNSVVPYREEQVLVRYGGSSTAMTLFALDPDTELRQGVLRNRLGDQVFQRLAAESGIYLGQGLADRLGVSAGDSVSLMFQAGSGRLPRPAQVEVLGSLHTATEFDHRLALISLESLGDLMQVPAEPSGMSLHVEDPFAARDAAMTALQALPGNYRAVTWSSSHGNLYEAIQTSRTMVALIVFLILAIAAFNVLASLMIISADRQADIAVLKTLGAERGLLMRVFTWQGLLIGLVGALAGLLLGLLLCSQLDALVSLLEIWRGAPLLDASIYPLDYLPVQLEWSQLAYVSLVAVLLSTLASLYPAWRLQSIRPAETLRYE